MSIFYDPKTKKVQPWIYVVFVLIPVVLVALLFLGSKKAVEKNKKQKQIEKEMNIFKE
jgi:hypothetical protein